MLRKLLIVALYANLMLCFSFGLATAQKPILIGSPLPLTGPYASDGEQMKMALQLAVEEQNANGGLLGRPLELKFGDVGGLEAEKIKAVGERLIGSGVDVVITGYDDGGVDTKVFGQYDVPYLHGNAMTLCTQPVAENPTKYWNCFQYTYNDKAYGRDAASHLFDIPEEMKWTPPNKKIAIIKVDYAYNITPADDFAKRSERMGYEVVLNETVPFGVVEWGPILSKIEIEEPSYITFWHLSPTDSARFMKQFHRRFGSSGIDALVYMQYTPSIPEFLTLAGEAATGLIWVGSAVEYGNAYQDYKERWVARFNKEPAGMYSVATRDAFEIWVQAVERTGCVDCYQRICEKIKESYYDGMMAHYVFDPRDQSALLGEYLMPLVWSQIKDGQNLHTWPKRFKEHSYQKPPWIK